MDYLAPYLRAAAENGAGFKSLLWTSQQTQEVRFEAFTRLCDFGGRSLLDAGCGRADLLEYLIRRRIHPADYTGIEAVPVLAAAALRRPQPRRAQVPGRIIQADFVKEPARMFVGAEIILFSGSLNTLEEALFHQVLGRAWEAAAECLIFNFLDSPTLAANAYLSWRRPADVLAFVRSLSGGPSRVEALSDYLPGDRTVAAWKPDAGACFEEFLDRTDDAHYESIDGTI